MGRPQTVPAMSNSDFREMAYVVARTLNELAPLLRRTHGTVCDYASGRLSVPVEVAEELRRLCKQKIDALLAGGKLEPALEDQRRRKYAELVEQSELSAKLSAIRTGKLQQRRSRAKPRQYPPYRMTHDKVLLLARAFKRYLGFIRGERQTSHDAQRIQDLDMELADISHLARQAVELLHAPPPYDYHINSLEWFVVSRALRFLDDADGVGQARSLYQHWRKYKGLHFKGHGRYAYRDATPAQYFPEVPQDVVISYTEGTGVSRVKAVEEEGDPVGHRDGDGDPDAQARASGDHELGGDTQARLPGLDVGTTIIVGAEQHASGRNRQPGAVGAGSEGSGVVLRTADRSGAGQSCPACGAGAEDDCRPGCALS